MTSYDRKKKVLIAIPTYNEAGNLPEMAKRLTCLGLGADILFIDDGSPDGTGEIADRIAASDRAVMVLHRPHRMGIGSAHMAGISFACKNGYDLLVTMDCDFAHAPEAIPKLLKAAEEADLVVGSRFVSKDGFGSWGIWRKLLSRLGHMATRHILGMPFDATGAFRVYRLDRIPKELFALVRSPRYAFFFESLFILFSNGVTVREVPIVAGLRRYGTSKMGVADMFSSLFTIVRLRAKTRVFKRRRC